MARPERCADAVVIGGGPGGALAAVHLARLGWHTVLIEKGPRDRGKACGHCLNRRAINVLGRAGITEFGAGLSRGVTQRFRAHSADGATIDIPMNPSGPQEVGGLIVDRSTFDQLLRDRAEKAGVEVIQPAAARLLKSDQNGAVVEVVTQRERFRIETCLVIGADGLGSAVARAAGFVHKRSAGRRYGFSFDVAHPMAAMVERDTIEMFVSPSGTGYLGIVNCGGGILHVAALVNHTSGAGSRNPLDFAHQTARAHAMLRDLGFNRMDAQQMQHLKAIGPMPWLPRKVASGAVTLVGDAARYIDPFTGEGMGWAIEAAELIGQVAQRCDKHQWSAAASQQYAAAWRRTIAQRQRLCRGLAWMLARPRAAAMLMRLGAHLPWIAQRVAAKVVAA